MNKARKLSLLAVATVAALAVTPSAHAGSVGSIVISNINVSSTATNGGGSAFALIAFSTTVSNPPSCAVFPQIGMAIDISSTKGKIMLSNAVAAFLSGKKVNITGQGNCSVPGGSTTFVSGFETVQSLQILQ
jgi:hypothetical protein